MKIRNLNSALFVPYIVNPPCTQEILVTLQAESGAKKWGAIALVGASMFDLHVYGWNRFGVVDLAGVDPTFIAFRV